MQASTTPGLPRPDETSNEHSLRCAAHLRACMRAAGGSISFTEFMREALYAPGLGYYAAGATKFGRDGDFVTAPEVSPLFGRVLARMCAEVLSATPGANILEFGAGNGRLALDVLAALATLDCVPEQYAILEVSADLRARQARLLNTELPQLADRVCWLDALPEVHRGVVIANEVLDALPVEIFRIAEAGPHRVRQLRVRADADRFAWTEAPAPAALADAVAGIEASLGHRLPPGYTSEYSPLLAPWVSSLCQVLECGVALLLDYGASRREYYAAEHSRGWLRCHFRHHVHDDPLVLPGIQDLGCWVDFTAAANAAAESGAAIATYLPQAQFLLAGGLLEELAACTPDSERERVQLASQVKMLTLPGAMGERFKCLGLARGTASLPAAFVTRDRTHTL